MIVHHGGAGTASAGLHADIPNIVIPFIVDQPVGGRRVHAVGAGPIPIPVKKLSTEKSARAILEAELKDNRERAALIGRRIRSEDGVGAAARWIEKHRHDFHRQSRLTSHI
jgi:sterol 3beta-glucosyltransferase